ncbi:hypothetical protein L6452_12869 [Arctium lappa]|uniref:Uncharacterized protein n=1 Tax=Arctium lappa TaxID=4217 RepID=A0ACB9CGK8_ARCLA|nr:hypothetical protein L6452_12869 [Arctium lappa]
MAIPPSNYSQTIGVFSFYKEARPRERRTRPYRKTPQASPEVVVTPEECNCIIFDKYRLGCFGKVGMTYFHKLRNKFYCSIVNVGKFWSVVPKEAMDAVTPDKAPLIDVIQFGCVKVLGKGVLPSSKWIVVKAKVIWKTVEKKIKEAGGAVVLTS